MAQWFPRKAILFIYVNYIGYGSRNDLDHEYSHTFIYSNWCLSLPNSRSQAAIVVFFFLKNILFSRFPIEKPRLEKFDLAIKYVKLNQGSSFEQTLSPSP